MTIGSQYGLGRHIASLDSESIVQALKWNAISSSLLVWAFSLPKFAIMALLRRLVNHGRMTTILFWGLALSSQACVLANSLWWFIHCTPIEHGWNLSVAGICAPIEILTYLGYFTSAYSAFLDIFFALYPIPLVLRLDMPLRSRIAVSISLSLSSLACIVSIYKLVIFGQVFKVLAEDPTYPVPYFNIFGIAEGSILIICASLPPLGPLFRRARGRLTSRDWTKSGDWNKSGDWSKSGNWNRSIPLQSGEKIDDKSDSTGDCAWVNKLEDPEHGPMGVGSTMAESPIIPNFKL
ncbi:hypothetical protein BP6252_11257 [Coleophoma cylindrospora]|uniref:Rhodopsin domain-containing protein n=1 Tax=Coleophoma cylindrospora TaxID=1849047 RepID=A0A3D8QPJ4_9HELO|nr:hypothetical protein BP6252_11257 [Coleophoma cylindrospora]